MKEFPLPRPAGWVDHLCEGSSTGVGSRNVLSMPMSRSTIVRFGFALLERNRLSRFFFVGSSLPRPVPTLSPSGRLSLLIIEESLFVETEFRRVGGADLTVRRFGTELLFVLGFDSLFGCFRCTDCSFPMMKETETNVSMHHLRLVHVIFPDQVPPRFQREEVVRKQIARCE
jgi:hypothetical protein